MVVNGCNVNFHYFLVNNKIPGMDAMVICPFNYLACFLLVYDSGTDWDCYFHSHFSNNAYPNRLYQQTTDAKMVYHYNLFHFAFAVGFIH